VRSARAALDFVEAVGFCSTFHRFPDGVACLWEAMQTPLASALTRNETMSPATVP
jgi:hypothetical protein